MTSGVYQLTFSDGSRYIGKSIDIENRWKQHLDKMCKGTAASAMQYAYNRCGAPTGEILCYAHSDHIDILEAAYIARNHPELNSDRPKDPFPEDMDIMWYLNSTNVFQSSTADHVTDLITLFKAQGAFKAEIAELEGLNDDLLRKRSAEELSKATGDRIREVETNNNYLRAEIHSLKNNVNSLKCELINRNDEISYLRKSWWQKIFN